jgi:hypothetical protein
MQHICVRYQIVHGQFTGKLELAVRDTVLGWFSLDDNQDLGDASLPRFVLELSMEPGGANLVPDLQRAQQRGVWRRASTTQVIAALQAAGIIKV